ncbi:MAG TPA: hypothetical protein DCX53_15425 [Anaerolineae bacterium]|nr:hypothetical protein [Anaerolineae bacterium]
MSVTASPMNRKRLFIAGIVLVTLFALCIIGLVTLFGRLTGTTEEIGQRTLISELTYCSEGQAKPCVVSFGIDADGNMLVNILLTDLSFPSFYLKIVRGESEAVYECQRIASAPNNASCIGEKMPPGEVLHFILVSIKDDTLLAEGNLSIIGLAFPTLEIAISTDTPVGTPMPTTTSDFIPSTPTRRFLPTPTRTTTPSYPNPSYP